MASTSSPQLHQPNEHVLMMSQPGVDEPQQEDGHVSACFRCFWFKTPQSSEDQSHLLSERQDKLPLVKQFLHKIREVSELVAGPRWKNFIRKIGSYFNTKRKRGGNGFGYDSYDYHLNFENSDYCDDDNDGGIARGFSTRFAPPASVHSHLKTSP